MSTVLCDCEAIINSRPLTYLTEESGEVTAITPAMFIQDIREEGVPDLDQIDRSHLAKHLRYQQRLKEELRRCFRIQYLGQLSQRNRRRLTPATFSIGDVVLIASDMKKRIDWPMARIKELYPGKDGHIRVVRLKTAGGELIRPIQKLIPLEAESADDNSRKFFDLVEPTTESPGLPETDLKLQEESEELVKTVPKTAPEVKTRSGRIIKKPERLGF